MNHQIILALNEVETGFLRILLPFRVKIGVSPEKC